MITALCHLYRVSRKSVYLKAAEEAMNFILRNLCKEDTLYVSFREDKCSGKGFLDDYASVILALTALYEATLKKEYIKKAEMFCHKTVDDFYDEQKEGILLRMKKDLRIMPCGNSIL